jgi:hypothetical protein
MSPRFPSLQNPDVARVVCEKCRSFAWTYQVPVGAPSGGLHHPRCPEVRRKVPRTAWFPIEGWAGLYSWPIEIIEDDPALNYVVARSVPHQPPGAKHEAVLWYAAIHVPRDRIVEAPAAALGSAEEPTP